MNEKCVFLGSSSKQSCVSVKLENLLGVVCIHCLETTGCVAGEVAAGEDDEEGTKKSKKDRRKKKGKEEKEDKKKKPGSSQVRSLLEN